MNPNEELLNGIYQNAEMGKETIARLIKETNDVAFRKVMENQLTEYQEIFDQSQKQMQERHQKPEGLTGMEKAATYMALKMNTFTDKTSSHMAEMLIQGSTMGTVDMQKQLNKCEKADADVRRLGERLLKTEQRNIEQMQQYL